MRGINTVLGIVLGIGAWVLLSKILPPAAAIGIGAIAVGGLILLSPGHKQFAIAGTLYVFGLAGLIEYTSIAPEAYTNTPLVALVGFGIVSGAIVLARLIGKVIAQKTAGRVVGKEYAGSVWSAISAIAGVFALIWTILTAQAKLARAGVVGIGGTGTLALNALGMQFDIPIWFLNGGLDVVMVVFVGCVVTGFHTLSSFYHTARATKQSARKGVGAASTAVDRARRSEGGDS